MTQDDLIQVPESKQKFDKNGFCKCQGPPCYCTFAKRKSKICQHETDSGEVKQVGYYKNSDGTQGRAMMSPIMIPCKKKGKWRNDANGFWAHKLILCDEHYPEYKHAADRRCRICGSEIRSCCC